MLDQFNSATPGKGLPIVFRFEEGEALVESVSKWLGTVCSAASFVPPQLE